MKDSAIKYLLLPVVLAVIIGIGLAELLVLLIRHVENRIKPHVDWLYIHRRSYLRRWYLHAFHACVKRSLNG